MPRLTVLLFALAAAGTLAAQQQDTEPPPVIFRTEVNYVEVDAVVTDGEGNVVPDLKQSDFDVLEDGKAQKIVTFARVDLPIQRPERPLFASAPVEPDVRTNQGIDGRIFLLVLDDLHTDFARTPRVRAVARQFIEQAIGVNDVAAVVYTGRNDASQDFTNNRRLLLQAVDKFSGRKLRSATLNQLEGATPAGDTVNPGMDVDKQERAFRARSAMGSIRKLSEFLAGVRGRRKAMLLFGEGIDFDVNQAMGVDGSTASIVLEDIRNAIAAAQRSNVAIYSIDPRGLFDPAADLIETAFVGPPEQRLDQRSMQDEVRLGQESLRAVSVDTGGFSVLNTNEFEHAFERIVRENSSYYLFGYNPTNDKRDGRFRKLEVRVKRPGLSVRSRSGYVAARGKAQTPPVTGKDAPPASVTEAINSPLPVSGVPMRVFAAAFKGSAPNAAIAYVVEFDASRFAFVNRDGAWSEKIEVINTAMDVAGKMYPGDRQTLNLTLKPETYQRVMQHGLRVVGQANLPPGRYQLRFAAGDASGRSGSVIYDLEVPDYSKAALALSGVALTSIAAAEVATIRPKDPLKDYLPGPAIATREFRQGDTITLFAEVYENLRGGQAHQVGIRSELRSDEGKVIAQTSESRSSSELQGKSGGYGFTSRLSLAGITPGLYVIHVEAQAQSEGLPTASHDVLIRVLP